MNRKDLLFFVQDLHKQLLECDKFEIEEYDVIRPVREFYEVREFDTRDKEKQIILTIKTRGK